MTDKEVIAAIRKNHLRANIGMYEDDPSLGRLLWYAAWVDPGGTIFGPGPYLKVPVESCNERWDDCVIRVYPPARLRRRLAANWTRTGEDR